MKAKKAKKVDLSPEQLVVKENVESAWSQLKKDKDMTQKDLAEKLDLDQSAISQFLRGTTKISLGFLENFANFIGKPITELDPDGITGIKTKKNSKQTPANFLYILHQINNEKPIAKIGITYDVSQRIDSLNGETGNSGIWWLYRYIDLGSDKAKDAEKRSKVKLMQRYNRRNSEVFYCDPAEMHGLVNRVIRSEMDGLSNKLWNIGKPDEELSPLIMDEFDEMLQNVEKSLRSEGCSQVEIDHEISKDMYDPFWWNL